MSRSRFSKGEFGHDGVADLEAARRGNEAAGGRNRQDARRDERHQARVPGGEVRREERVAARNVGEIESGGGAQPQDGTLEGVLSFRDRRRFIARGGADCSREAEAAMRALAETDVVLATPDGGIVTAGDLRGGAALVVAGLFADEPVVVKQCHYIHRGYENLAGDLCRLGAVITENKEE